MSKVLKRILEELDISTLKQFSVSTNDSKFDNVAEIIGDNLKQKEMYCITNNPINDGNYIQRGGTHTVLGMEYISSSKRYGFQVSMGTINVKYRNLTNNIWSNWKDIIQGTGVVNTLVNDFNDLIIPGNYAYGGQNLANKPNGSGFVEVLLSNPYMIQRITSQINIGIRFSDNNGATWSNWKYFS